MSPRFRAMLVSERIGQFFLSHPDSGRDRLEYTEYGAGDHWVVLLHGQLMPRRMHQPLARALAAQGLHVVTLDLLGHGRSDRPADPLVYSMTAFAEQVVALLDHLGAEQAVIGGTSLGANVSLEMAVVAPERVKGLIARDAGAGQRAGGGPDGLRSAPASRRASCRSRSRRCAGSPARSRAGSCRSGSASASTPATSGPSPLAAVVHGIFFGRIAPSARQRRQITVPALVVGHPADPIHPAADSAMVAEEMPNATFVRARSILEWRARPERLDRDRRRVRRSPAGRRRSARGAAPPEPQPAGGVERPSGSCSPRPPTSPSTAIVVLVRFFTRT